MLPNLPGPLTNHDHTRQRRADASCRQSCKQRQRCRVLICNQMQARAHGLQLHNETESTRSGALTSLLVSPSLWLTHSQSTPACGGVASVSVSPEGGDATARSGDSPPSEVLTWATLPGQMLRCRGSAGRGAGVVTGRLAWQRTRWRPWRLACQPWFMFVASCIVGVGCARRANARTEPVLVVAVRRCPARR
jgi:hypothetical protein